MLWPGDMLLYFFILFILFPENDQLDYW
jgi:hypothetical protein